MRSPLQAPRRLPFLVRDAALAMVFLPGAAAGAQTVVAAASLTAPVMTFTFDWPAQTPAHYEISVAADGMGRYRGLPSGDTHSTVPEVRPLLLSQAATARLQAAAIVLEAGKSCETSQRKLAQTGTKTLRLEQGGGQVLTCSYNYSDDRRIQEATAVFQAIAMTMEEAPRLEHLHRYDRLGLDAELATFTQSVRDGRAIEVGNIAPTLRSLAGDSDLLERVRSRAATLLQRAAVSPAS